MPLYSKKEFSDLCNKPTNWLSVYVTRGKVNVNSDGLIDTADAHNRDFLLRYAVVNQTPKSYTIPDDYAEAEEPVVTSSTASKKDKPAKQSGGEDNGTRFAVELQLKKAQRDKALQEIELNKLKLEKQRGEVIPTELVRNVITVLAKTNLSAFKNATESVLTVISAKYKISGEDMALFRSQIISSTNEANKEAAVSAKKMVKNIVEEYTKKKAVGEHE
jgi:hypothetical protein